MRLNMIIGNQIIIMMLIEEIAKINLILSEKGRSVDEIYFDHNHEKI